MNTVNIIFTFFQISGEKVRGDFASVFGEQAWVK